jgi:hypothetical protein
MTIELSRNGIDIIPENVADEVYIEQVLGLVNDGDAVPLVRISIPVDGHAIVSLHAGKA